MSVITNKAIAILGSDYQAPVKTIKSYKRWVHTFTLKDWENKPTEFEEEFYNGFITKINKEKEDHPSIQFLPVGAFNSWVNHIYEEIPLQLDIRIEGDVITINYQVYTEIDSEDFFNK